MILKVIWTTFIVLLQCYMVLFGAWQKCTIYCCCLNILQKFSMSSSRKKEEKKKHSSISVWNYFQYWENYSFNRSSYPFTSFSLVLHTSPPFNIWSDSRLFIWIWSECRLTCNITQNFSAAQQSIIRNENNSKITTDQ